MAKTEKKETDTRNLTACKTCGRVYFGAPAAGCSCGRPDWVTLDTEATAEEPETETE